MRKRSIILLVLCLSYNLFFAQIISSKDAKVTFKIKNAGFWVRGNFKEVTAELIKEHADWNDIKLSGNVASTTIKTGIELRDRHLRNDDYFDTENFPGISLELLSCDALKDGILNSKFRLTIKDVEKDVKIPLVIKETAKGITISGSFKIDRLDYGLGKKSITLSNEVVVDFYSFFSVK